MLRPRDQEPSPEKEGGSLRAREETALWEAWFAEFAPRLLLFARQQTRTEADAEDVFQDAILRCWRRCPRGTTPPLNAVFSQIRRTAIDLGRSLERRRRRDQGLAADPAVSPVAPTLDQPLLAADDRAAEIGAALRQIDPRYAEVLVLKIWGELTFKEIAKTLKISMNTAASRYRYGLRDLRELMPRSTGEAPGTRPPARAARPQFQPRLHPRPNSTYPDGPGRN